MDKQQAIGKIAKEETLEDYHVSRIVNRTDDEWIQALTTDRITCSQAIKERTAVLARKDNVMPKVHRDFIAEEINILDQYRALLNERIIRYLKNT